MSMIQYVIWDWVLFSISPFLNQSWSNFGFYISWPILTKYMIPHQISTNLNHIKSQLISTNSNASISDNSQPIWVNIWILHLMTNPNKVYDTTQNLNPFKSQLISTTCHRYISSQLWINFVQTLDSAYQGQS